MYLKIGTEFADRELTLLSELLALLDRVLNEVDSLIATSICPDTDGLFDRGEYFIGVGFSAIQQYVVDTLCTGLNKKEALNLGPRYSEEFSFIAVINSAANWHKHSAEWEWFSVEEVEQKTPPNQLAMRTKEVVLQVSGTHEYPLSNVLAKLQNTKNITLSGLLPHLILWRSAVDKARK